jgi:hypothetical protein
MGAGSDDGGRVSAPTDKFGIGEPGDNASGDGFRSDSRLSTGFAFLGGSSGFGGSAEVR